jgi:hypothetical protein
MKSRTPKKRPDFKLTRQDEALEALVKETNHRTLAVWAADCAGHVLHHFGEKHPGDPRPRDAIGACRAWADTGLFHMADIRRASLAAHAAARIAGEDNAARSAARAAGQAAATPHVPTHSLGAANYALQAVFRAADPESAEAAVAEERDWQYRRLMELRDFKTY